MQAVDVLLLVGAMTELGVVCWLDGGWGVDCLLREQTRDHGDLDLVVGRNDVNRVIDYLERRGYQTIRDGLPTSIALRDQTGREVDLHPVDLTADGGGDQLLQDGSARHYSSPVQGAIAGGTVACASPQDQLLMHLGYEPRAVDFVDLRRIAERFSLPLPAPFDTATDNQR